MQIFQTIISNLKAEIGYYAKGLSVLFVFSVALGALIAALEPRLSHIMAGEIAEEFSFLRSLSSIELFAIIFLNNVVASLIAILGGIAFGIIPILFIIGNGLAIGVILAIAAAEQGPLVVLLGTVPHGIFEIPAIIIATSFGVLLGEKLYQRIRGGTESVLHAIGHGLGVLFRIVVPLLFIAAAIEVWITGGILRLLAAG